MMRVLSLILVVFCVVTMTGPVPQPQQATPVLQSSLPEDPIEPPADWAWGAAGQGFGYRAKQSHSG